MVLGALGFPSCRRAPAPPEELRVLGVLGFPSYRQAPAPQGRRVSRESGVLRAPAPPGREMCRARRAWARALRLFHTGPIAAGLYGGEVFGFTHRLPNSLLSAM